MGFNAEQYSDILEIKKGDFNNADGTDPYAYFNENGEYDNAFGDGKMWDALTEMIKGNVATKGKQADSDLAIANAIQLKASQQQQSTGMSPLAITGIVVGSLLAITVMIVVIKKVKTSRQA